jgi:hypothetical protein
MTKSNRRSFDSAEVRFAQDDRFIYDTEFKDRTLLSIPGNWAHYDYFKINADEQRIPSGAKRAAEKGLFGWCNRDRA